MEFLCEEAARFRGYSVSEWDREGLHEKARALAHYLEHGLREAYAAEKAIKKAKGEKDQKQERKPGLTINYPGDSEPEAPRYRKSY